MLKKTNTLQGLRQGLHRIVLDDQKEKRRNACSVNEDDVMDMAYPAVQAGLLSGPLPR